MAHLGLLAILKPLDKRTKKNIMVNRGALILKCREPFLKWLEKADPSAQVTLEQVNEDRTVYLISDEDAEDIGEWLLENFETLFEDELEGWYRDENTWPQQRDFNTFKEWFDVEVHSVVLDTVGGEIFDDDI